jgi:hypothetical protein
MNSYIQNTLEQKKQYFQSTFVNKGLIFTIANERFVVILRIYIMGIQWFQVFVCLAGLSIPVSVLLFAAADTARAKKESGEQE